MNYNDPAADFSELVGKTLTDIKLRNRDRDAVFTCSDGTIYKMGHFQDCCEVVDIDDVVGDINDLIGSEIIRAEERTDNYKSDRGWDESGTWTFYELATIKGSVTIKWLGLSNGYYSESVDFRRKKV